MATVYDWSPFFNAINGQVSNWGQRNQVNSMIDAMSGKQPAPNTGFPAQDQRMTAGQTTQGPNALAGVNPQMLQMLRSAPPQVSMPLLLQLGTQQRKYSQTPQYDQNGNAFVLDDQGNMKPLDGVKARTKVELTPGGDAYDPYSTAPGTHFEGKPNPNQPFNADGTPNKAYQAYEAAKARASQGPAWAQVEIARQNQATRATNSFTPDEGALMGALAERGVSLPTGFRSKEQQKTLYQGILARNPDKTPDEIADLIKKGSIELGAQKKETQTAAAVAGRVEVAQNEMEEFIPLVREAAAKVPRGNFVPLNRLMQTADSSISDPNLKVLKGRINALLNAYDMLAARGGTDMAKREEVRNLLTSADGPEALAAQLDSFTQEAAAAHRAAVKATKVPELAAAPGPGAANAPKVRVYNPKTGKLE